MNTNSVLNRLFQFTGMRSFIASLCVQHAPMASPTSTAAFLRIAVAVVAWFGVLLQLWLSVRLASANGKSLFSGIVIYLEYFTVITNIFVALVYTAPSLRTGLRLAMWLSRPAVAGCATTSIVLVGIAYHSLLRELWSPQGAQWLADVLLHYVVPAGALAHWLLYARGRPLAWRLSLLWCAYPVIYLGYALVRGELIASYPYPFIDVSVLGYRQALINAFGLLLAFFVLGLLVLGISRLRSKAAVEVR